jgi:hypothetical protein
LSGYRLPDCHAWQSEKSFQGSFSFTSVPCGDDHLKGTFIKEESLLLHFMFLIL